MYRTIKTSYLDNFADGTPRNTYAYPTKLTDPAGNFSQVKYRYDIGANVEAISPTIDGNAANSGKETTREFDTIGRPIKETLVNTGDIRDTNISQIKSNQWFTRPSPMRIIIQSSIPHTKLCPKVGQMEPAERGCNAANTRLLWEF